MNIYRVRSPYNEHLINYGLTMRLYREIIFAYNGSYKMPELYVWTFNLCLHVLGIWSLNRLPYPIYTMTNYKSPSKIT
jgi:hypothetical protein